MKQPRRSARALLVAVTLLASFLAPAGIASAASDYDSLLKVSPSLYVYSDGGAKTQKMDISTTWWAEFKQSYAKRIAQNIGWPSNFVSEFEDILASGSWGVYTQETPDGNLVSIVGTKDPDASCGFAGPANSGAYQCVKNGGYGFVRADYFTHNSYGNNGCMGSYGNRCSDVGMNIYASPIVSLDTNGGTFVSIPNSSLSNHAFFVMNFDLNYPTGYEGEVLPLAPSVAKYVGLGDSFSSGEGNPPFEAGTNEDNANKCHRSSQAYSRLLHGSLNLGPTTFVACAGATTADLLNGQWNEPAQLTVLTDSTEKVTLTIGGNDAAFTSYLLGCVVACGPGTPIYDAMIAGITQPAFKEILEYTYERILQEAPNAQLYVADYPYLSTSSVNTCWGLDFSGAYEVQTALNEAIRTAVENVSEDNPRIHYVPTNYSTSPFTGGELCGGSGASLFNGFMLPSESSLHPNALGQQAYATVFEEVMS